MNNYNKYYFKYGRTALKTGLISLGINSGDNVNAQGIMYSDDWRFVQCRFAITGHSEGNYTIVENHIY